MSVLRVEAGNCWIHLAFDAAAAIDLEHAASALPGVSKSAGARTAREALSGSRRTPPGFQFNPLPLRVVRPTKPIPIGGPESGWMTVPEVELTLYDFGAVSVAYRLPLTGLQLDEMGQISSALYDDRDFHRAARAHVERVMAELEGAATRLSIAESVEDYVVFHCAAWTLGDGGSGVPALVEHGASIAQVLRAENELLSESEVVDALACVAAYGRRDVAIIDWNAAILFEPDAQSAADLLAVLEFANVQLVELRFLDDRLDAVLNRAYRELVPRNTAKQRHRLASLQMDGALLFEGINNAIKLVGDQYLARIHRLAAKRFHLADWDAAILRKLETVQRLYEKAADEQSTRRMEALEWIIIILIALSILIVFIPGLK